jgi:hypothetical protein
VIAVTRIAQSFVQILAFRSRERRYLCELVADSTYLKATDARDKVRRSS